MKKIIILLIFISVFYLTSGFMTEKMVEIPEDALRIRIIPNSNSEFDQNVKRKVKDKLEVTMYDLLKGASSTEEARRIIEDNLDLVNKDVEKVLNEENYDLGYEVNYGYNYFPDKEYRGIKYDEGYYESIVISIGKAEGDNWWCVLFPNLCLVDLNEKDDVEYRSWVSEIINKIF